MPRNPFSSSVEEISLEDALGFANTHLENAGKEKDISKALQLCREAKSFIKDAEKISASKKVRAPAQDNGIADAYYNYGVLLDSLGYHSKAQKGYSEAEKWGYIHATSQQTSPSHLMSTSSPFHRSLCPPAALSVIPSVAAAMYQGVLDSKDATSTSQIGDQSTASIDIKARISDTSESNREIIQNIFRQDIVPPTAKYDLPKVGGRLTSTLQLAYCLSLMDPTLISKRGLDDIEYNWSLAKSSDPDERARLKSMATDMVRAFIRDELKKQSAVTEVVSLAAVLEQDDFRKLLQVFVESIEQSILLDLHLLKGLTQLIRNAAHGYIDVDDLVKILELLSTRLRHTHKQSSKHTNLLALTISRVLDSMVDSQVQGLSREHLHEPLSEYLGKLQNSSNPFLVYQAANANQALQYISGDSTILQLTLRRTGEVVQGISGTVSAMKALDLNKFIEGLHSIQGGLAGTGEAVSLIQGTYLNTMKLTENGQSLLGSLQECFSFTRKSSWYPALRGLDALLQEGRFAEFETLVREAPCKHDDAFQWGVCQRLGELAIAVVWDDNTRKSAIDFLGELYKNDATWGQQAIIKQWILVILRQLDDSSEDIIASYAQILLGKLETCGSTEKQALYKDTTDERLGPESYPMLVTLPPQEFLLLDCIQGKPDIESPLRQLKRIRLQDWGGDVYISPKAKSNLRATDEFDLTSKVEEFLDSNKKVFLILGDSGAGKSTFNRALEVSLWDKYDKIGGQIPLFIQLSAIEKPEYDLITKQLQRLDFTDNQIKELKMHHQFTLICDGYDESQQTRNLYMSNQLNQAGGWRARMVISCRTEYSGADYKDCFQPIVRNDHGNLKLFQEAVITPFNKNQIRDYVNQYVSLKKSAWESDNYLRAFKQVPNLQDLVKNPFLLKLALEVLPRLLSAGDEFSAASITRVGLYDEFIMQWIERSKIRLEEIDLSPRDNEAFRILLDFGFQHLSITYLKEFVTAIYDNQCGNPTVTYSGHRDRKTWKEIYFNSRDGKHLLQEAIPLIRNGDQYRFIHKSVLEYGLALTIFDPSEHDKEIEPTPMTSRRGSASSILSFEVPITSENTTVAFEQPLLDSPLGRKNLVSEPSILIFLVERVQLQPRFKDQLLAVIERSKSDKTARTAAANAITILVKAGVQFNGADLRGIKIPGADLSFGVFDSAQLEGADLRKANIRNIWLRNATLNGAQMSGVQFGELPIIREEREANCCTFSPDGKTFAAGLANGKIGLYELSSWDETRSLLGHGMHIRGIAFSATGDQIASGGDDQTIRLWDVDAGECIFILQGHSGNVTSVVYSPNGHWVVSGSSDKTVRIWNVETGGCIHTLQGHQEGITSVDFSPQGNRLISSCWDGTIKLWDTESGNCIHNLQGHTEGVPRAMYSPRGDRIVSGAWDHTVRIWDGESGKCIHILEGHSSMIDTVIYSPKGDLIASGGWDKTVRLWDTDTGSCIHTLKGHDRDIISIKFSPKGDQVASGSDDGTVRLWDVDTGDCVHTLRGHESRVTCFAYSPRGNQIATGSWDSTIRLWDVDNGYSVHTFQGHTDEVLEVTYTSEGNQIASGGWDETVRLWDVDNGSNINILRGHGSMISSIAYSPNGGQIASGSGAPEVLLWDTRSGKCVQTLEGHDGNINGIAYSPKGDQIASGSSDKSTRLWDAKTGKCIHTLQGHDDDVSCIAYSPVGNQVASGSEDATVRLWDVENGNCVHTLKGHTSRIVQVVYSPNGDRIASGGFDRTSRLWDVDTGSCLYILQGHDEYVTSLVYSPNGDQIASGSEDKTVRLWGVETGNCAHILEGHKWIVASVVYSPNGDQVASGSRDGEVRMWDSENGQCLTIISGFNGSVNKVVWENSVEGQYLVTGSTDRSVRRWQILKEPDGYRSVLCWSSSHKVTTVSGASFEGVRGLSRLNWILLDQRGALVGANTTPE